MAQMSSNLTNIPSAVVQIAVTLSPQAVIDTKNDLAHLSATSGFATRVSTRLTTLADAVIRRFPQFSIVHTDFLYVPILPRLRPERNRRAVSLNGES